MALAMVMGGVSPMTAAAQAEVTHVSEQGFAVLHVTKINAPPEVVWATLIAPQSYWNKSHSWSGDSGNMYLDPQAGGCFCEKLPTKSPEGSSLNSVEHMRVIYSERPRVLRMSGALGPLQSEGVIGTMNIAMEADGTGTKISLSYVVGGFMRMKPADIAPAVDAVLGELLLRLKARAEGRDPTSVVWPPKTGGSPAPEPKPDSPDATTREPLDKPKAVMEPPANISPSKADPATKEKAPSATPALGSKPPLGERLKATDTPEQPPAKPPVSDTPSATKPATPDKAGTVQKQPIVEEATKKKPAPVPPGTR